MDITIHASFLPHDDPDASLAFYRVWEASLVRDVPRGSASTSTAATSTRPVSP
jgi:hypothetical protein